MPDPRQEWNVLDEAALLWTPEIAARVQAAHVPNGLKSCVACPTGTSWPCVMRKVAERVRRHSGAP